MITEELKTFINKMHKNPIFKLLPLFTLLIFATFSLSPTKAYALSLILIPPPSEFVKKLADLLLLSTVVLIIICLVVSALLAKPKKAESNSRLKFSKHTLKTLIAIGVLFLIFRLSLQTEFIRNLINKNYQQRGSFSSYTGSITITQKIVVGFKKGVSQEKAEEYLKSRKIEFIRTEDVNMGKIFFYNTDLKYIVTVPFSDTDILIAKFRFSPLVYDALKYSNNPNEIVD